MILEINRRFAEGVNFITTLNYFVSEIRSIKCVRLCESHRCLSRSACLAVRQASMAGLMLRKFRNKIVRSLDFLFLFYQEKRKEKISIKILFSCLILICSSQKVSAESLGNYKNIEQKLSSGQLALAQSLIAAFSPTTNIENNYKTFYTLQRAYLQNQDLTMLQNIQLLLLAYQCPFTDGAVVYNARALYGLANMVSIDYNDAYCAQLGFSFKTNNSDSIGNTVISDQLYTELIRNEKVSKETFKNKTNYFLFPNPAKDELFVNSANTENELIQLEILDANAKTIAKQVVSINNYLGKLNLNLINGVYTVKITTKQGTYEYKKLIISN